MSFTTAFLCLIKKLFELFFFLGVWWGKSCSGHQSFSAPCALLHCDWNKTSLFAHKTYHLILSHVHDSTVAFLLSQYCQINDTITSLPLPYRGKAHLPQHHLYLWWVWWDFAYLSRDWGPIKFICNQTWECPAVGEQYCNDIVQRI